MHGGKPTHLDELVVHPPCRQQAADRHALGPKGAVAQHNEAVTPVHGLLRLGGDAVQCCLEPLGALLHRVGGVNDLGGGQGGYKGLQWDAVKCCLGPSSTGQVVSMT